jgi:TPR repeat protein
MNSELKHELYEFLANKGNPVAQYNLAMCPIEINNKLSWLEKSAEQGYSLAQNELGYYHLKRWNKLKAIEYLSKSADQNDPTALYYLGICYLLSADNKEHLKAWLYFAKARTLGYNVYNHATVYNVYNHSTAHYDEIEPVLLEYHQQSETIAQLNAKITELNSTIEELQITAPIEGIPEYQKAKARFDEYKKNL